MSITVKKDGRVIKTGRDYTYFRVGMWHNQSGQCVRCYRGTMLDLQPFSDYSFHVHHKNGGRGLGGGKRNDTAAACEGLCGFCHRKAHNQ